MPYITVHRHLRLILRLLAFYIRLGIENVTHLYRLIKYKKDHEIILFMTGQEILILPLRGLSRFLPFNAHWSLFRSMLINNNVF